MIILITLVPFTTGLVGRFPESKLAALIYVSIVFLWTLCFQFLDTSILKNNPTATRGEVMFPIPRLIIFGVFS